MAIIYSYPINTMLQGSDILVGTSTKVINGKNTNATKSFTLSSLASYVEGTLPPPPTPVIPDLSQVLTAGNDANNDIYINKLHLLNPLSGLYPYMDGDKNRINFYNSTGVTLGYFGQNRILLLNGDSGTLQLDTLTDNRTYTFPNQSGTVAMVSDIPTVSYAVANINPSPSSVLGPLALTTGSDFLLDLNDGGLKTSDIIIAGAILINTTGVYEVSLSLTGWEVVGFQDLDWKLKRDGVTVAKFSKRNNVESHPDSFSGTTYVSITAGQVIELYIGTSASTSITFAPVTTNCTVNITKIN